MGIIRDVLRKAFGVDGQTTPLDVQQAIAAQGMDGNTRLGPGTPIAPSDGYSTTPRSIDYQPAYNVSSRPRNNERLSFQALRGLVDSYDIAQMCITHRIDSIRSLDWNLQAMPGVKGDVTAQIQYAHTVLRKPDGELYFKAWLSKFLWDVFAFDAGCLYRQRNNAGRVIGLTVVDGTTIAPLLDEWGGRPAAPAPAYVQFIQGTAYNWLTDDDLVYVPFRPTSNTPYGRSPLESVLLNANTDLRFQQYFLLRFTAGNIPEGFAIAPEQWTPAQVADMQAAWDALLYGDDQEKSKLRWVPNGTSFDFPNKQDFTADFSTFLMKKTAGAYHVTPGDLGFTEDSNRSTGESQESVQQRVGDLPMIQHIQDILSAFLQDDLGLPLEFIFDTGGEQEDRLQTAQADEIYINSGVVGVSEIRERRFGLVEADGQTVPRFIFTTHLGPIAVSSLLADSAPVDLETAIPEPGVVEPATQTHQLAIEAPTVSEASTTTPVVVAPVTKAGADELAVFRRFAKARAREGKWRDFQFATFDKVTAHRLNVAEYSAIRKADGDLTMGGLCVRATDTGRVLMIQRALDPTDPAGGTWEFPGGHIEPGESAADAAMREWVEEVGLPVPNGQCTGQWFTPDGVYAGFVWTIPTEAMVPPRSGHGALNPDDPDGDNAETIAWWDSHDLSGNPAVRPELAADLRSVYQALNTEHLQPPEPDPAELVKGGVDATTRRALHRAHWLAVAEGDGDRARRLQAVIAEIQKADDAAPFVKAGATQQTKRRSTDSI